MSTVRYMVSPAVRTYLYIMIITIAAIFVLGAGFVYVLADYQGRSTPAGIILLLTFALQFISNFFIGRQNQNIQEQINGNLAPMSNKIDNIDRNTNGGIDQ